MGLTVEDQKAVRVEMMKARFAGIINKADKVLSDPKANSMKDGSNINKSDKDQEAKILPQQVKRPRKNDGPKFMVFNDSKKVSELEREAEARLTKRRRLQEIKREREAARKAINNAIKTVDFDNLNAIEEYKKLIGCPYDSELEYGSFLD